MKKTLLSLLLFSGLLGCICGDHFPYWNISDVEISILDKQNNRPDNNNIEGDSIQLAIQFTPEYVADNFYPSFSLMNAAYAVQCPVDGEDGMKDPIKSFSISCNRQFNAFEAGASLNSILENVWNLSLEEFITGSANWDYSFTNQMRFFLSEQPETEQWYQFFVTIELESGSMIQGESESFYWK